jgi:hypothetical protein
LLQAGFPPSDLYAANEWKESAHALKESQSFSDRYHGPAQRALKDLSQIPFLRRLFIMAVLQPNPR